MAGEEPGASRADRIGPLDVVRRRLNRARGRVFCLVGRHDWALRRNPDVGGPRALYQQCRRCGRERTDWALRGTFED